MTHPGLRGVGPAAQLAEWDRAVTARDRIIEMLKSQLAQLHQRTFGQSSEKLDRAADQLELQIEELEQHQAEHSAAAILSPSTAQPAERAHPIRKLLPAHLPRESEELAPPYAACPGCGGALRRIGGDVSGIR